MEKKGKKKNNMIALHFSSEPKKSKKDYQRTAEELIEDPAEYLFANVQYHDCYLTVGNPDVEEVDVIGAVRSHLAAHSTVFRSMIVDSGLADPTGEHTHVQDVSPQVFRLMLRHVYGGDLNKLKDVSSDTLVQLALCADKYNIQPLLRKACKRLLPTGPSDVFPALKLMGFISSTVLEPAVSKILQENTRNIIDDKEFLQLPELSLEFILKNPVLSVSEVEVWKCLVKWSQSKATLTPNSTPRQYLKRLLLHVRLATLTEQDIIKFVMPTKILTPDEVVDLLTSISTKQQLETPLLCSLQQKRQSKYNKGNCYNSGQMSTYKGSNYCYYSSEDEY